MKIKIFTNILLLSFFLKHPVFLSELLSLSSLLHFHFQENQVADNAITSLLFRSRFSQSDIADAV